MIGQYPGMPMQQMTGTCPGCGGPTMMYPQMSWSWWPGFYAGMQPSPWMTMGGMSQWGFQPGWTGFYPPTWGNYWPRGMATDDQIREMVYQALDADPSIPYDADINVEVTGGIVTLTGTVPNKRVKHAAGDDAWWIPDVVDVNNRLEVKSRRAAQAEEVQARPQPTRMRAARG